MDLSIQECSAPHSPLQLPVLETGSKQLEGWEFFKDQGQAMVKDVRTENLPELYPLTGLQIGDIQSYVSQAFVYFTPSSNKILILVDNRPWLMNKLSRSARLWQLMVTKYRMSPFMNTRTLRKVPISEDKTTSKGCYKPTLDKSSRSYRWLPAIDSAKWQEKYLLSLMDLSKALHGFIIFEVAWKDVHGINYLNELQTDTSLALEVKSMKKWEFNGPDQASRCIPLWFPGRTSDVQSLKNTLRKFSVLDAYQWDAHSSSNDSVVQERSPDIASDDDFLDVLEFPFGAEGEINSLESCAEEYMQRTEMYGSDHNLVKAQLLCEKKLVEYGEMEDESAVEPTQYADTLILFRFSSSDLPFKFRQIIMSDLRLLTLLEAGLPSWVIFFQSYPLFCYFYRPWMRHMARTLYIMISLVTVIIGFYDLYKNVPLLKSTAARLCGPLFGWIEEWDMVSRIRYLGTMLFLQNLQKGYKWFRMAERTMRAILPAVVKPLSGPFSLVLRFISPLWNACSGTGAVFSSTVLSVMEAMYDVFLDLIEILLWPFETLYSYMWSIAMSIHAFLCYIRDLFFVPVRCALTLANYIASMLCSSFCVLKDVWRAASRIFQLRALAEAKQGAHEISMWRGLWNDLFSQIFRATRSIINGLAAFLMTCNRHRLSIYNHIQAFLQRLARLIRFQRHACHCQQRHLLEQPHEEDNRECDRCK